MAKKIAKKSLPWLLILGLLLTVILGLKGSLVKADDATTSVEVGNVAPAWTIDPFEDPASWGGGESGGTGPTNVGDYVVFKATATDANNDQWKLVVCKTTGISGTDCDGGESDRWCASSYVDSGSQASCQYQVQAADAQSKEWYAYACDASGCSSVNQGSGNSGSPFKVNRRPSFTDINNPGSYNPGADVTWTATASDSDSDTYQDKVRLIVCKTTGLSGDDCDGGESDRWCRSTNYETSDPSCTYSIPSVNPHNTYNAYVYIVDWHYFASDATPQGTNMDFTVNDVAPTVSSVVLYDTDELGDLTLTVEEGETSGFKVKGTVTDNNSCQDLVSVVTSVYRSGIGWSNCDAGGEANNNYCYALMSCVIDTGVNDCTGPTDPSAAYLCTFGLQYHADPTDDPSPEGTPWTTQNWRATIKATDESNSHNAETATGLEMLSFPAIGLASSSINYGNLAPGQANSDDITVTIKATGNVALDAEYSGTNMFASGKPDIPVEQQKYDLISGKVWASMDHTLSGTASERELNCQKTITTDTPANKPTYFRLKIPEEQPTGNYSGTNTFGAVVGELSQW